MISVILIRGYASRLTKNGGSIWFPKILKLESKSQKELLEKKAFKIIKKGRKYRVADFEKYLVDA